MPDTYVPSVAGLPPVAERTLPAVLRHAMATVPDRIAIEDPDRRLGYADLVAEALAMAGGFAELDVAKEDPVLLMLDNSVDYVVTWLALGLTGRIEVPVNTAYVGTILTHVINNSGAKVMVIEDRYLPAIDAIADSLDTLRTVVVRGSGVAPDRFETRSFSDLPGKAENMHDAQPWELMAIMYTSGTTGLSKGVRVTHAHAYGYAAPQVYGACGSDDRNFVVLPLFHVGGQWKGVYNALIAGAGAVVMPRFSARTFWQDVKHYGCTYTLILGAMAEFLLRQPQSDADRDHSMTRCVLVPVVSDLESFKSRFGIGTVSSAYGSTEASVVLLSPQGGAEPGMIGWCRPDFEARLVDENDVEVPRGSSGELVLRAREPWVIMDGYHAMPEATLSSWRNLWFHTGDMMRQDERGMFAFVDRLKDAIRRRGENVSSFEVEQEIIVHPDVTECAVVAVPSDDTEDEILACVVLRPGAQLSPYALRDFVTPRLPNFMVPRYVRIMAALPKTPTEKIRKQALREDGVTADTTDLGPAATQQEKGQS